MRDFIFLLLLSIMFSSCEENKIDQNYFLETFNKIPSLKLPFKTNSSIDLSSKIEVDSAFQKYAGDGVYDIYGSVKINDSILGIVYLLAGDIVFPQLVTYSKKGKRISELILVNLPGGSDGYNSNGSSYLIIDKEFNIQITDTVNSFERNEEGAIIDSTYKTKIIKTKYIISPNGVIEMD